MKACKAAVVLLALVPMLGYARKKPNKTHVLAIFNQARYVYVQAVDGREFNSNLLPEDRQAIADVDRAIEKWGRYVLTIDRSQADLVFVVRRGRMVTGRANVGIGRGPASGNGAPGAQGSALGGGGEIGPPDDLLWVCTLGPDGKLSPPLWSRTEKDGLESPDVPLLREFEREVDQAYPRAPAGKTKKP